MLVNERIECKECGYVEFRPRVRVYDDAVIPDTHVGSHSHFNFSGGEQEQMRLMSEVEGFLKQSSQQDFEMMIMFREGNTRAEIAKELSMPEGTVGRRLSELRLELATVFRDRDDG